MANGQVRAERAMDERAARRARYAPVVSDPQPVADVSRMWTVAGRAATIGIFLLLFGAFLYLAEPILMPVLGAAVIATMLSPLVKRAKRFGMPPWLTGTLIVTVFGLLLGLAATMMAGPVGQWIGRAPEIEGKIKRALSVLAEPLSALTSLGGAVFGAGTNASPSAPNVIMPVLAFVTPAVGELLLFFGTLVFILASQIEMQANLAMMFGTREAKLRALKIMRDIERNLARYLTVVTLVNATLGIIVALGTWALGLPNPLIFGMLAAILNYLPYIGPGVTVVALFGVGLVTSESLGYAAIAPICLIALCTLEGHFITPTIVGHRLTLNPLVVFLGLAFWSWLWGPVGAFFAVPLTIGFLVIHQHVFADDGTLQLD
jgi:predicted PurR-regulated permease PerM